MHETIIIDNEDKLFNLLDRLNKGENIPFETIDFTAFTKVKFKITGEEYQGKITSTLCYSLTQFHDSILRLYCLSKYKDENLARLTEAERENLQLTFTVEEGCTLWGVDLNEVITNIGTNLSKYAFDKMDSTQLTFLATIAICGLFGFKMYDRYKKSEDHKIDATQSTEASKQMAELAGKITQLAERSTELYIEHIKSYDAPSSITITAAGETNHLNQDAITELTKRSRRTLKNEDGIKEIEIDSIKKSVDRLVVTARVNQDYTFPLYVDTSFIDKDETDLLFDAFKNNEPIKILADFKIFEGKIEKANASSIIPNT